MKDRLFTKALLENPPEWLFLGPAREYLEALNLTLKIEMVGPRIKKDLQLPLLRHC